MTAQHKTALVRKDYEQMQTLLEAIWQDGTGRANADPLTLAHALIAFSIDRLLDFHAPAEIERMCIRQVSLLGAMHEKTKGRVEH